MRSCFFFFHGRFLKHLLQTRRDSISSEGQLIYVCRLAFGKKINSRIKEELLEIWWIEAATKQKLEKDLTLKHDLNWLYSKYESVESWREPVYAALKAILKTIWLCYL